MIRRLWDKFVVFLYRIGADPNDSEELKSQKVVLVGASLLGTTFGMLGVFGLSGVNPSEAITNLVWGGIVIVNLLVFSRTRKIETFRFILLSTVLIIPFIQSLLVGGIVPSGGNVLWAAMAPLLALASAKPQYATRWFYAFLVVMVISGILEPYIHPNDFSYEFVHMISFTLIFMATTLMAFIFLAYFVNQKNTAYDLLAQEQEKSENLLLNILPKEVAVLLKDEERTIADHYEAASILFADIVGFTPLTEKMAADEMVDLLNAIYSHFDSLVDKHSLEKIRTIGDNYLVASGVPTARPDHAQAIAYIALEMQAFVPAQKEHSIQFRIGINSGPLVAGVIGNRKFQYDVWGDTVNTASRMESHGVAGRIQVTRATYELLEDEFLFEPRGTVEVKGKGKMATWFLVSEKYES